VSLPEEFETQADHLLYEACREVACQVLFRNGQASADLIDTIARKYLDVAKRYQDFVRGQRESDEVIAHAVRYIAHVHAIPSMGTDTTWFETSLHVLMGIAVPNTRLNVASANLMPCLQEGIQQALASLPVDREDTRLSPEDASELARLQAAGVEHGVVTDLLNVVERVYHGDLIDKESSRMLMLAALAAPMVRHARGD
jgi:fructose-1,6-bisphosphatase/sedoheptulose 1,7-bisphosphatase-like protein